MADDPACVQPKGSQHRPAGGESARIPQARLHELSARQTRMIPAQITGEQGLAWTC